MHAYQIERFGPVNEALTRIELDSPTPGPDEVLIDVRAISLNFRDLLVVRGLYNPKLPLPAIPISDGAGVVTAVGSHVRNVHVGAEVVGQFIADWQNGPYLGRYGNSTLGLPGPGFAAEQVVLPARACVPIPAGYSFAQAATLPIAALTAWSALVTVGHVLPGEVILTLGTGGVSIFALQLGKALGTTVIITSSSDEKLDRARELGADHVINYKAEPKWEKRVLELTGDGVDLCVETGGAGTLSQSLRATAPGGTIAMLGALTGLEDRVNLAPVLMKRLHIAGIYVDSREAFEKMNAFIEEHDIQPVIDRTFAFEELPAALECMANGEHFGKIVLER